MRVRIVDPPAYTPPYDRALCAALARAGADVELLTSPFRHGAVPPAEGYAVREEFYRGTDRDSAAPRRAAAHLAGMLRHRRDSRPVDVEHYQWLTVPRLDRLLLPRRCPRVLTGHGWLRVEAWKDRPPRGLRHLFDSMDAVVALSEWGAQRLREGAGLDPDRVEVIPHGPFEYLTRIPDPAPLPAELEDSEGPVVLSFGLIRPYKGVDVLLDAFRAVPGATLWVVGRPFGVDEATLRARAAAFGGRARTVLRFVEDREIPAIFDRADVVVLPYRDAEQSGVLYTALAFGKPLVLSDVGGFGEVAALGAADLVPPGDADALAAAIARLVENPAERERLAASAREAATGPYSWERIAARHLDLYRRLLAG
jgi:glycosyltransferase involved in cell wall biosynthesis